MFSKGKKLIGIFLVTLFLVFKVSGLHSFYHSDDDNSTIEQCEMCDISSELNFVSLLDTENSDALKKQFFFSTQKIDNKAIFVIFKKKYLSSNLFTRPPPQITYS